MTSAQSEPIEFVDPDTGEYFKVLPQPHTIEAAYKLGFLPASAEDHERADAVEGF